VTTEEQERQKFAYNEQCRLQQEAWRAENRAREAAAKDKKRVNQYYREQWDKQRAAESSGFRWHAGAPAHPKQNLNPYAKQPISGPYTGFGYGNAPRAANLGAIRLIVKAWALFAVVFVGGVIFSARHELVRLGKIAFESPRSTSISHPMVAPVVTSAHVREMDFSRICQKMAKMILSSAKKSDKTAAIIEDGVKEASMAVSTPTRGSFENSLRPIYGDYVHFIAENDEEFATGHPVRVASCGRGEARSGSIAVSGEAKKSLVEF